ncbi:MAG: hypothetical protein FJZ38_24650 [Candidatus Rokubacteria bacterium]|nr:hypothetical protein [Candidatus Rokubacteria bacterium]
MRVIRDAAEREYDLLRFELGGDVTQNPLVEEGMRVHVPVRLGSVTLTGGVRRPGEYEVLPNSSLADLLALVGGPTEIAAPSQTRLTRYTPDGRRETLTVDLRTAITRPADVILKPGDVLAIPSTTPAMDVVEVRGAFVGTAESAKGTTFGKPVIVQRLELAQGDRVRDVVGRVGGAALTGDLRLAFVDRRRPRGPRSGSPSTCTSSTSTRTRPRTSRSRTATRLCCRCSRTRSSSTARSAARARRTSGPSGRRATTSRAAAA